MNEILSIRNDQRRRKAENKSENRSLCLHLFKSNYRIWRFFFFNRWHKSGTISRLNISSRFPLFIQLIIKEQKSMSNWSNHWFEKRFLSNYSNQRMPTVRCIGRATLPYRSETSRIRKSKQKIIVSKNKKILPQDKKNLQPCHACRHRIYKQGRLEIIWAHLCIRIEYAQKSLSTFSSCPGALKNIRRDKWNEQMAKRPRETPIYVVEQGQQQLDKDVFNGTDVVINEDLFFYRSPNDFLFLFFLFFVFLQSQY